MSIPFFDLIQTILKSVFAKPAAKEDPQMPEPIRLKLDIEIPVATSRQWKGIVWHHSATPDSAAKDWDSIRRYHTSYRVDFNIVTKEEYERRLAAKEGKNFQPPWKDIGYHGGVERLNGKLQFVWGRPLSEMGAHAGVKDASNVYNQEYLGLCVIGEFDTTSPDPETWDFCVQASRAFMDAFRFPASHVIGHREVFDKLGVPRQKTCPGTAWDLEHFRSEL